MSERKLKRTRGEAEALRDWLTKHNWASTQFMEDCATDWLTMHDAIKKWADARRDYRLAPYADQNLTHPMHAAAEALAKLVEVQDETAH